HLTRAPRMVPSGVSATLVRDVSFRISISFSGFAKRNAIMGNRLCPPASIFAAPSERASSDTASPTESGATYSNCGNFMRMVGQSALIQFDQVDNYVSSAGHRGRVKHQRTKYAFRWRSARHARAADTSRQHSAASRPASVAERSRSRTLPARYKALRNYTSVASKVCLNHVRRVFKALGNASRGHETLTEQRLERVMIAYIVRGQCRDRDIQIDWVHILAELTHSRTPGDQIVDRV